MKIIKVIVIILIAFAIKGSITGNTTTTVEILSSLQEAFPQETEYREKSRSIFERIYANPIKERTAEDYGDWGVWNDLKPVVAMLNNGARFILDIGNYIWYIFNAIYIALNFLVKVTLYLLM